MPGVTPNCLSIQIICGVCICGVCGQPFYPGSTLYEIGNSVSLGSIWSGFE